MTLSPVLYFPHGAGPMPLLGEPNHKNLCEFLADFAKSIEIPKAILVISAHWEESKTTVLLNESGSLLYDYYGFPDAAYQIKYPAKGNVDLVNSIIEGLQSCGLNAAVNRDRGWDHGVFVPLKIMFPEANIPVVQLSLQGSLEPGVHISIGKALAPLREQGILILGSGSSFHNMGLVHGVSQEDQRKSEAFDQWLVETCTSETLSIEEKQRRLTQWKEAPHAAFSHPREEHLIPLHVCFGAALDSAEQPRVPYTELFMGVRVCAIQWA